MSKAVSKSISLNEETWALIDERAPNTPGRDRSGYIANLVEEDLRGAGLLPLTNDEADVRFFSKLSKALRDDPKLKEEVAALLPRAMRRQLAPA
jgi:hypothetical protein